MDKIKQKLAAYSALSGAFIATDMHKVEAQITYVDLPDNQFCIRAQQQNNQVGYDSSIYNIGLNVVNGSVDGGYVSAFGLNLAPYVRADVISYRSTSTINGEKAYSFRRRVRAIGVGYGDFLRTGTNTNVILLSQGVTVGSLGSFGQATFGEFTINQTGIYVTSPNVSGNTYSSGDWVENAPPSSISGYFGFRFNQGMGDQYGWARATIEFDGAIFVPSGQNIFSETCMTIHEYAYGQPGEPILTGEGVRPIPTLSQWGMIILNLLLLIFGITTFKRKKGTYLQRHRE